MPTEERDPLSIALERSFGDEPAAPSVSAPVFDEEPVPAPKIEREEIIVTREEDRFANTHKTLNDLKKEWAEMRSATEPSQENKEPAGRADDKTEEENYAYPFGSWTDEANYHK